MRFGVLGAYRYKLGIAAKPIREPSGERRRAKFYQEAREIRICPRVPAVNRLEAALHELGHAWLAHTGGSLPTDEETFCDLLASFTIETIKYLKASGGETALMRLSPGEMLQPGAARAMITLHRFCGQCTGTVAPGSVECVPADGIPNQVTLRLFCGHCNHLQVWNETAGPTGLPSAERVGENRYVRGRELAEFLVRNPEAARWFD